MSAKIDTSESVTSATMCPSIAQASEEEFPFLGVVLPTEEHDRDVFGEVIQSGETHVERDGDDPVHLAVDQSVSHALIVAAVERRGDDEPAARRPPRAPRRVGRHPSHADHRP